MTAHTCTVITPGCFRCDLNKDEVTRDFTNLRLVQILLDGLWQDAEFGDIKIGDVFRLFEDGHTLVVNRDGQSMFKAASEPYIVDGVRTVNAIPGSFTTYRERRPTAST
jgi:hypothetical protein